MVLLAAVPWWIWPPRSEKACGFDAYETLFDVHGIDNPDRHRTRNHAARDS
jgi:hypothetical protein